VQDGEGLGMRENRGSENDPAAEAQHCP
jgi:hypothetical protein